MLGSGEEPGAHRRPLEGSIPTGSCGPLALLGRWLGQKVVVKDGTFSCTVGRGKGKSCIAGREDGVLPTCPKGGQRLTKLLFSPTEAIRGCNLPEEGKALNCLQETAEHADTHPLNVLLEDLCSRN